jgi:hypothetical protein
LGHERRQIKSLAPALRRSKLGCGSIARTAKAGAISTDDCFVAALLAKRAAIGETYA